MYFRNQKRQITGKLVDNVFKKIVDSKKHKMKTMDAYAIDEVHVTKLNEHKCTEIRIKEEDTGKVYKVDMLTFLTKGFTQDHGHGQQRFLPMKYWELSTGKPTK